MNWQGQRDIPARIFVSHDPALEYHEWITLGERVRMNRLGIQNPRMHDVNWTKWKCNNPQCPAWAVVSDDGIRTLIDAAPPGYVP